MSFNQTQQPLDAGDPQAAIRRAVEDLLASISSPTADAIRLGAIPHWVDEQLLGQLTGDEGEATRAATYLRRFRFVRQDAQGHFHYQAKVRDYLLAWWREERPDSYRAANRSALDYFRALADAAPDVERPVYERQVLYHMLVVDERAGLRYLGDHFEEARERYQLGQAEGLVAQAAQLEDILTDHGRMWVRYFTARLDLIYRRDEGGEATFQDLADHAPEPVLRALAGWSLGQIRVNQGRWSQAIQLYRASLDSLQRERAARESSRVMLALGDAYRDLADSLGGFQAEREGSPGRASRFLYALQHLPFLAYQWLVRHLSFLPNWYFGTNYQDWIIAYLLMQATSWYRRAERDLEELGDRQGLAGARLSLAELEHQVGRWSRARRRYAALREAQEIQGSLYRTARVQLGQGRAYVDEGDLIQAEPLLTGSLETFRRFRDQRSMGVAANLLGGVYADLGRPAEATQAYLESARAFEAVGDRLARTRVAWKLEDLAQRSAPPAEQALPSLVERLYITRFPDTLLRWFRRLALLGALPLTYVLTFAVGLGLILSLVIIEGELVFWLIGADVQTTVDDALILAVFATLPVPVVFWLYRLIYSLLGVTFVRYLGRRLIPIERDQPSYLVTDATGLTRHDASRGTSRTVAWSDVSLMASVDYYLWRQSIQLISGTALVAGPGTMMVYAITAGYTHLKQDLARHLAGQRADAPQRRLDFVILDSRWVLSVVGACLAFALSLVVTGRTAARVTADSGAQVIPPLTSFLAFFVPTLLLVFPAVVLWRMVGHQMTIRRRLRYRVRTIPVWVLWLAAAVCSLLAVLWVLLVPLSAPG